MLGSFFFSTILDGKPFCYIHVALLATYLGVKKKKKKNLGVSVLNIKWHVEIFVRFSVFKISFDFVDTLLSTVALNCHFWKTTEESVVMLNHSIVSS